MESSQNTLGKPLLNDVEASSSSKKNRKTEEAKDQGVTVDYSHNAQDEYNIDEEIALEKSQHRLSALQDDNVRWEQKDLASDYDFCIVFPAKDGKFTEKGSGYIQKLYVLGFELYAYKNLHPNDEILVLIRCPIDKIRAFADVSNFNMWLSEEEIRKQLNAGNPKAGIEPVDIAHRPDIVSLRPYEYIFGKYNRNISEDLYWREKGQTHPFREVVRLKITALILESRPADGSENLKIQRYLRMKTIKECFALHNYTRCNHLKHRWERYPRRALPMNEFKEYFGEKIGLMFVFLEYFTNSLSLPAIVGVPLQIAVFAMNDFSAPFLPFFSFALAIWSVLTLELWKRHEKFTALKWGMIGFEDNERDRPDFRGEYIKSFIDGSTIRYFPSNKRNTFIAQSLSAIVTMILLVIGVVVSIYILRYEIKNSVGDNNSQTVASTANAVQIQIMNYLYMLIANALTERENHRTFTEFEDSMIAKIFLFQFVNSYASFFFLAFVAENLGDCDKSNCMENLGINLAIIFSTRLLTSNLFKLVVPYFMYQYSHRQMTQKYGDRISRPEAEMKLARYDIMVENLDGYAEQAIQFGYTAMFISALPMAATLAFISNVVNIKGMGWKLFTFYQRPVPKGGEDIGAWQTIFLLISIASVITNAGLTVFTMDVTDDFSKPARYWIFILFQWICFSIQAIVMAVIPDEPEEVNIQTQRTEFIVSKLIDLVQDDVEDDVTGDQKEPEIHEYIPLKVEK